MKSLLPLLALAACAPVGDAAYDAFQRSGVTRICVDGTTIGLDPQTRRYVALKRTSSSLMVGFLAPGVTPETACAR